MYFNRFSEDDLEQFPVYAGCECVVRSVSAPSAHYDPWRVDLASANDDYSDFVLIYGHLTDVQVKVGEILTPESLLGYLETTKHHVHVEMRRVSDNAYVNPWPYLAPKLQSQLQQFIHEDTFLPGGSLGYPRYGYYRQ